MCRSKGLDLSIRRFPPTFQPFGSNSRGLQCNVVMEPFCYAESNKEFVGDFGSDVHAVMAHPDARVLGVETIRAEHTQTHPR